MSNRDRILMSAVTLFNHAGVAAVSTNHIAKDLGISPGNLYFHFGNKEDILRELFAVMAREVEAIWQEAADLPLELEAFFTRSMELIWRYRFFHREMYQLRRKDPKLARLWREHLKKATVLLTAIIETWERERIVRKMANAEERAAVVQMIIVSMSTCLQFFESSERSASRVQVARSVDHLMWLLRPLV